MQLINKEDFAQEMVKIPVIFWNIDDKNVVGQVVGTSYQLLGDDPEKIKMQFSEQIKQDQLKYSMRNFCEIEQPALLNVRVPVRPFFRMEESIFPVVEELLINVPVVFGLGKYQSYECYLPLFMEVFHCYEKEQVKELTKKIAVDFLQGLDPFIVYSYLFFGEPRLDEFKVTLKSARKQPKAYNPLDRLDFLIRVAEKQPPIKSEKQKIRIFPDNAWERGDFTDKVVEKINLENANLIIVGEPGTGKTAVMNEAIRRISKLPDYQNLTFWRSTPTQIVSGAKYLGEWQKLCENLVEELESIGAILWLQDMFSLLTTNGTSAADSMAAFLLPFLKQQKFRIAGEMTPKELEAARKLLPGFVEHFQILHLNEMDKEKTLKIFDLFNGYTSRNYGVEFTSETLHLAYRLLNRFLPYEKFPGKAIRFLSDVVSNSIENGITKIKTNEIITAFVSKTGLPDFFLRDDILLDKSELINHFTTQIIGQEDAIERITSVIKVFKTGINNPQKPIATMVFAGPTGVGKTASAKLIAGYFFGHGQKSDPLVRFDMSEFQHPGQIDRLIGSGASSEPGKLIRFVRENPFSVVLFDEIEKANPAIFDVLMTVFDEGTLTDAHGRITDFRNTIIVMTTNLGSQNRESIGLVKPAKKDFLSPVKNYFRPEFFNRIDHLVVFNPLDQQTIRNIAIKELNELQQREGFQKRNIKINFTDATTDFIARTGFDKNLGARPLQRAIEQHVTTKLAKHLLQHKRLKNTTLVVDFADDKIVII